MRLCYAYRRVSRARVVSHFSACATWRVTLSCNYVFHDVRYMHAINEDVCRVKDVSVLEADVIDTEDVACTSVTCASSARPECCIFDLASPQFFHDVNGRQPCIVGHRERHHVKSHRVSQEAMRLSSRDGLCIICMHY